jgi:hypothetical protein
MYSQHVVLHNVMEHAVIKKQKRVSGLNLDYITSGPYHGLENFP